MPDQTTLTSLEEYLATSYEGGDREYIDGQVVERNLGEKSHSRAQGMLLYALMQRRENLKVHVFPEQRIQIRSDRFRVPDLCVYLGSEPDQEIFTTPPFLVIEILSKDDKASELEEKLQDYLGFGVPFVWVIDPRKRRAWMHTPNSYSPVADGVLRTSNPELSIPLEEILPRAD